MNVRKNGIKVQVRHTRKVDPKHKELRDGHERVKTLINTGKCATLFKEENGMSVWSYCPFETEEYNKALEENFKVVEVWNKQINHELEII